MTPKEYLRLPLEDRRAYMTSLITGDRAAQLKRDHPELAVEMYKAEIQELGSDQDLFMQEFDKYAYELAMTDEEERDRLMSMGAIEQEELDRRMGL